MPGGAVSAVSRRSETGAAREHGPCPAGVGAAAPPLRRRCGLAACTTWVESNLVHAGQPCRVRAPRDENCLPCVAATRLRLLELDLRLGRLGSWRIVRETRESPPLALQARTWTRPSRCWATVTPIVLDRHPKADYVKDLRSWMEEVAEAIAESCHRQGLPEPFAIDVNKNSWHRGVPRAVPGKTGFPLMPVKPGQPARQQVHACLWFGCEVEGPVLLGAGRYRGYGLCKPLAGGSQ